MKSQSYLTFRLRDLTYGISISRVKEIFQLPELIVLPETPRDIIGVLYLRNRFVPIMHLDRRLHQPVQECRLSDRVILIEWQNIEMGIVVNEVLDVLDLDQSSIDPEPDYGRLNISEAFIEAIVRTSSHHAIILDAEALIREPEAVEALGKATVEQLSPTKDFFASYCPSATSPQKAIFRQRAKELEISLEADSSSGKLSVAVFGLGEECFACDLDLVREFIDIEQIVPIPMCPNHILGQINLRGEIIPLVDIRPLLDFGTAGDTGSQAIVIRLGDLMAGIVVDEVLDVVDLDQNELNPAPMQADRECVRGIAPYQDRVLSALDMEKLMSSDYLIPA